AWLWCPRLSSFTDRLSNRADRTWGDTRSHGGILVSPSLADRERESDRVRLLTDLSRACHSSHDDPRSSADTQAKQEERSRGLTNSRNQTDTGIGMDT